MLYGRMNELKYLEGCYGESDSTLLVVYGQRGIGKTALVKEFVKNHPYSYYLSRNVSAKRELELWAQDLSDSDTAVSPDYNDIFKHIFESDEKAQKKIIIIDEFNYFAEADDRFMYEVDRLLHNAYSGREVMIILISSDIYWIENEMVSKAGAYVRNISGFLKIKPLDFLTLVRQFPDYSFEDQLGILSITGGNPYLWGFFNKNRSLKENICEYFLGRRAFLSELALNEITRRLREPQVYYTILSIIAGGDDKLNELHHLTGYSRPKISVYIKNLIDSGICEKIFSIDTKGHENTKKGVYGITSRLVFFYFRFIFPHLSELEFMNPGIFYDKYIKNDIKSYLSLYYKDVCTEYLKLLNAEKKLPVTVGYFGSYYGKYGNIDILGKDENGRYIAGFCCYEKNTVYNEDYDWFLYCLKSARVKAVHIYIFSGDSFDEKLRERAKNEGNLTLIGANEF